MSGKKAKEKTLELLINTDGYGQPMQGTEVTVNTAHVVSITEHIYMDGEEPEDEGDRITCFVELSTGRILPCSYPKYLELIIEFYDSLAD